MQRFPSQIFLKQLKYLLKLSFETILNFLSSLDQAEATVQNLKELFRKKKNESEKTIKSENLREAVEKVEQGFKALAFFS